MPIVYTKCPQCGNEFDCGGNPLRRYCNPRCRSRANQAKERVKFKVATEEAKPKVVPTLVNPSAEVLTASEALVVSGAVPQFEIVGELPEWESQNGVSISPMPATLDGLPRFLMMQGDTVSKEDMIAAVMRDFKP